MTSRSSRSSEKRKKSWELNQDSSCWSRVFCPAVGVEPESGFYGMRGREWVYSPTFSSSVNSVVFRSLKSLKPDYTLAQHFVGCDQSTGGAMDCATIAMMLRDSLAALIRAEESVKPLDPEPRWPAVVAILAVGGLYTALPAALTLGPRWLFPSLVLA